MESFAVLEPAFDGFRNYLRAARRCRQRSSWSSGHSCSTLTAPEMAVLVGGMRALNANFGNHQHGVFTDRPETLTNDFFVNLLDMGTEWKASGLGGERVRGSRPRRPARSSGRPRPSTSSSVRTPSSEPFRRSTL